MFEDSITEDAKQKYILLELDTFYFENSKKTSTAYCLIEHTPIQEMGTIDQFLNLHKNLIKNYKTKNWKFCEDVIEKTQLTAYINNPLSKYFPEGKWY
jgi:hypothetical protein